MPTIPFTFSQQAFNDYVDAICYLRGYQVIVPDPLNPGQSISNPETKNAFAKRMKLIDFKGEISEWKRLKAIADAAIIQQGITPDIT